MSSVKKESGVSTKKKYVIKVLVAGAGGVGKTTLLHKVTTGEFLTHTQITIGVQFHLLNVEYGDSLFVLQLWDFGGQERFRFMLDAYVAGAKGAMLLYDTTRIKTREEKDTAEWISIIRKQDPNLPVLLIGTKIDKESDFVANEEEINHLMTVFKFFDHTKISSLSDEGITGAFKLMVKQIAKVHNLDAGDNLEHFRIDKPGKK
jgi:small GTP-binding protein